MTNVNTEVEKHVLATHSQLTALARATAESSIENYHGDRREDERTKVASARDLLPLLREFAESLKSKEGGARMIRSVADDEVKAIQARSVKANAPNVNIFTNVQRVEVHATKDGPLVFIHEGGRVHLVECGNVDFID
ncbi:hypothetical protein [Pararhizobium mangrovi]|uniref:Uncharacterized protein n=1 Tax=Pararhizobium mangrovi TaxID=2590452 RepID=A0A506U3C9_9HYPH|nr:hypothetical protein [Pararhizobium mangrovi]TPW26397.1 hypothetical protein FJU11_15080 [Pararhizobium mangrovi]